MNFTTAQAASPADVLHHSPAVGNRPQPLIPASDLSSAELDDDERESQIAAMGKHMQDCMEQLEATHDERYHLAAGYWLKRQNALIAGRSAARVARMEAERGLA